MRLAGVMHPNRIVELLVLLAIANGAPVVVKRLLGDVLAYPLDGGKRYLDGRPLFGSSKTIRGIATSIGATAGLAPLLGTTFTTGLLIGTGAMAGDLLSSFVKRRMRYPSSSRALGIDQIPEALLPAVVCNGLLGLSPVDITLVVALFFVGEIVSSHILFKLHVREQPY
jgi:CDP-2,3-bis-(O-geranylgeranyl)-sn-glycerol synthase